jgi:hypothetical protein
MRNERGSALLSVLIFAVVVAIISVPLFNSVLQDRLVLAMESEKTQNHYAIESVVEIIKARDTQSQEELSTLVNQLMNKNSFINIAVGSNVKVEATNQQIIIETKEDRKNTNLVGQFYYTNSDFFLANLFVTKKNSKTPSQNIGLTPNCPWCSTHTISNGLNYFFTDVDDTQFDQQLNNLKATFTASPDKKCLEKNVFDYSFINCTSSTSSAIFEFTPAQRNTKILKVTNDVFVNGDLYLEYLKEIEIVGDLIVYGNLTIRDVEKVKVHGRIIVKGTVEIKNPGGGNGGNGVVIDAKGIAAGGDGSNYVNIIDIHAHGNSNLFQSFLTNTSPSTGQLSIRGWEVNVK